MLYRAITIRSYSTLSPSASSLLSAIRSKASLRKLIRQVNFKGCLSWLTITTVVRRLQLQLGIVLGEVLGLCPSLERVVLDNVLSSSVLDDVVSFYQANQAAGGGGQAVKFCFVAGQSLLSRDRLRASYEGFQVSDSRRIQPPLNLATVLQSSQRSIRRLDLRLLNIQNFSGFQNLEHLALRLRDFDDNYVLHHLPLILQSLPTLLSLSLNGTSQLPILVNHICMGTINSSFPPSLNHLILEKAQLSSHHLLAFLHHTPATTSLKRLNCSRIEKGVAGRMEDWEESQIVGKFQEEKGISLVFDEKWEIW